MMDRRSDERTLGHSVADELAREGKALEARMLPEQGPLSEEQLAYAIKQVGDFVQESGLTFKQVAREIGKGESTISLWLGGKYTGDRDKLARVLVRWMRGREEGHRAGMPTGVVSTTVADRMFAIMREVHKTGTMGAIVGPSGCSKSIVCQAALAMFPGAVHIELTSSHRTRGALIRRLAREFNIRGLSKQLDEVESRLHEHLRGTNRLLIPDEAHYLSRDACNVLRDLHKATGCPVVFVGTRDVLDTINDFTEYQGQFGRLFSFVYNITEECQQSGDPLFTVDEVVRLAKSMGLRLTGDGAEFLTELCSVPGWGGFGKGSMVLLNAKILAKGGTIELKHLRAALRQMEGHTGFERVKVRMASKKARVA